MVVSAFPQISALDMATVIAEKSKTALGGDGVEVRVRD